MVELKNRTQKFHKFFLGNGIVILVKNLALIEGRWDEKTLSAKCFPYRSCFAILMSKKAFTEFLNSILRIKLPPEGSF